MIEDKELFETLGIDDPESKRRVRLADRTARAARAAAKKAREAGNDKLADQLDKKAEELEDLVDTSSVDTIDDTEQGVQLDSSGSSDVSSDGQQQGGSQGQDGKGGQKDDKGDQEGEDSKEGKDGKEGQDGKEESAGQAAARAQAAAAKAQAAAQQAAEAAAQAQAEAAEAASNGDPSASEKAEAAQKAAEAAAQAAQAAQEAQEAAQEAQEAAQSGNADEAKEAADKAEKAAQKAQAAAQKAQNSGKDKGGDGETPEGPEGDPGNPPEGPEGSKGKKGKKTKGKGGGGDPGDKSEEDEDEEDEEDDSESEDENETESDPNDPVEDPFADEEDIPDLPIGNPNGKEPREATVKDIIKQIKGLKGEARRGAIQGLKDLIDSRKPKEESLHEDVLTEAKKGIRDMSEDEFGNVINSTLDLIDQVDPVQKITDTKERKERVKKWESDPLTKAELDAEDNMEKKKEEKKRKAHEKELNKYKNFRGIDDFTLSFEAAIKDQITKVTKTKQTYDEIDPETEGESVIYKADVNYEEPDKTVPIIDVYFDCSGSWDDSDVEIGKNAIATVKKKYVDTKKCKLNIWYFANNVYETMEPARREGGTGAWKKILENIKATRANNIVIMTDSDMNGSATYYGLVCRVGGCVWWLWRDGYCAKDCTTHLIGRRGNYQFRFESSN